MMIGTEKLGDGKRKTQIPPIRPPGYMKMDAKITILIEKFDQELVNAGFRLDRWTYQVDEHGRKHDDGD